MAQVLNTLLPVFVVIALGYVLATRGFLSHAVLTDLNRLLFWVCLPALIVNKLATASDIPAGTGSILLVFSLSTITVIALGLVAARVLGLEHRQVGTFVQAAFRGNLAYAGIPLILFALRDRPDEVVASTMAQTLFVFAPTMILYNSAAVVLLARDKESPLGANLAAMFAKVAKNPLILASVLGALLFFMRFRMASFISNSLELIGQMAAPAALLCVGGSMAYVSMRGRYRSATVAAILKVAAVPCLSALIAMGFDLSETSRLVLLILSATPTAVASYIMAKEMNGDEALAAGAIVLSTILSMPAMAVILALN